MAQFLSIENILINPEAIELAFVKANGLITFVFSDGEVRDIDSTASNDPNDLSEIKTALEASGLVTFSFVGRFLVNPNLVSYITKYNNGTLLSFKSGHTAELPQTITALKPLIDERDTGKIIDKVEGFSLAYSNPSYGASSPVATPFTPSSLYSGILPQGITFNSGVLSGFEAGRWLITPGMKYTSGQANSLPNLKTLVDGTNTIGSIYPNYPLANEAVYGSYSFVENLTQASTIQIDYQASNSTPAQIVVRCSFVKLADAAPLISNPNNAVTIGGIVVTINGIPLVI